MPEIRSCQCLNIRLHTASSDGTPIERFHKCLLDDPGVEISLIHLTTRQRGIGQDGSHFTSVTCLVCRLETYRVQTDEDVHHRGDSANLAQPSDWIEPVPLQSKDGWVLVSNAAYSGAQVEQAITSSTCSVAFGLLTPKLPPDSSNSSLQAESSKLPYPTFSPNFPPLFLAPPFVPAHPVFHAISRCAVKTSDGLRRIFEEEIEMFLKTKLEALSAAELTLKSDVEALWTSWKTNWTEIQRESTPSKRPRSSSLPRRGSSPLQSSARDFPSVAVKMHRPTASLLSQSLSQSSIHSHMSREPSAQIIGDSKDIDDDEAEAPGAENVTGDILEEPFVRARDDDFAVSASHRLALEDDVELAARLQDMERRRRAAMEREAQEIPQLALRGRSHVNARKVQFQEEPAEKPMSTSSDTDRDVLDMDPLAESLQGPDDSLTPIGSPRRGSIIESEASEETSGTSSPLDDRETDLPKVGIAQSMPVNIGLMHGDGIRKSILGVDARVESVQISSSVVAHERMYAARDVNASVDPGPTLTNDSIEEEDETETSLPDADLESGNDTMSKSETLRKPGMRKARLILEQTKPSENPDNMWRSMVE